jgi:poly(3-hydroxybutyrate) depolymerase
VQPRGAPQVSRGAPDRDPPGRRGRDGGAEASLLRVEGGGHAWAGGTRYLPVRWIGPVSQDFDAATRILRSFDRHLDDGATAPDRG